MSACAPTARSRLPLDARCAQPRARARDRRRDFDSVAIVFMHAYAYPEHERQAAELAREAGFSQISVSHEVSPLIRIVGRGDTTVADAYLSPVSRLRRRWRRASSPRLRESGMRSVRTGEGRRSAASSAPHPSPLPTKVGKAASRSCSSWRRRAGSSRRSSFTAATRSSRDRRAAWSAWRRRRGRRASSASSASTWAARRRTSRISRATTSGASRPRWRACVCARRCSAIHTVAAGGGSILTFDGSACAPGPKAPAPIRVPCATGAAGR